MNEGRDFDGALAKAGAFVRPLEDHVGYRAMRPPYHCPGSVLLNGKGAEQSVGRFDGCTKLPTLYISASPTAVVLETRYGLDDLGHGGQFVMHGGLRPRHERAPLCIVPVRVRLERVLHLEELLSKAPGLLPITLEEVSDRYHDMKAIRGDYVPIHELALAARSAGIQGVLYPSRHEPGSQNLAVFVENVRRGALRALYGLDIPCRPGWWRWSVIALHTTLAWATGKRNPLLPAREKEEPCPEVEKKPRSSRGRT